MLCHVVSEVQLEAREVHLVLYLDQEVSGPAEDGNTVAGRFV